MRNLFAVSGMPLNPGTKLQVAIPGKIAYGARGTGPIGANETLLFDMELIEIKK